MCDQTEISYSDEEVVWVKLGNCWWPGEVVAQDKLSPDVLRSFRKPPIATVKFFQEDAYEYVKNINSIYKYQCSRKHEFINKGLCLYRTKHGHMEKFPQDVIRAETKVGGDIEILARDEFQESKKESYAGLFGTPAKKASGAVKKGRGRPPESPKISTPVRRMKEKTEYKVHILVQGSKSTVPSASPSASAEPPTPSTSTAELPTTQEPTSTEPKSDKPDNVDKPVTTPSTPSTPSSGSGIYACHACSFTTTRLNVLILHNKSHSVGFMSYTPSPVKKKPVTKSPAKLTPTTSKTLKQRKPRKEKTDKPGQNSNKKRSLEDKTSDVESKKLKTDEEIKSSLLADWDDDVDDESATAATQSPEVPLGALSPEVPLGAQSPEVPLGAQSPEAPLGAQSPEVPLGAESPAVPTPAELPNAQVPPVSDKKSNGSSSTEKPEASSDSNKYEFCEDEDWPVEADAGRKIPRVKNPVRTEETKSISIDEDDMAREVAELLNRTAVPELPSVPEPLKVEENFPEPSVVKSPDKKFENSQGMTPDGGVPEAPVTKAIFKTKTFFRSRHSRSQDAIGKYVAEQLNNVEKMDIADCDLNGSDNVSSPEARDSPPIEHVKVARLAPKIQLKRMKAEAQLRERERNRYEPSADPYNLLANIMVSDEKPESPLVDEVKEKENADTSFSLSSQNVLYPPQEIKPRTDIDSTTEEIKEETVTNYDASTEGDDTRETIIEDNHQVAEESESSQETYGTEIDQEENENKESNREIVEEVVHDSEILYQESIDKSIEIPGIKIPEQLLSDTPEPIETFIEEKPEQLAESCMNESTASAVDALLSVSREADRVTRTISDDPPEDLFEDDNKDGSINSNINGETNDAIENEEESEPTMFPKNEQELVMTEEIKKEQDQIMSSVNEEHPAILEESEKNLSCQNIAEVPTIHEEIDQFMALENKKEIPETNQEPNQSLFSINVEEIPAIDDEPDQSEFSSNVEEVPALHETPDQSVFSTNVEEVPALHETPDQSVFSTNVKEIHALHEETDQSVYCSNVEELPAIHDEPDQSEFSSNVEEVPVLHEEPDQRVFSTNVEEMPGLHEEPDQSVFSTNVEERHALHEDSDVFVNVEHPAIHEEPDKGVFTESEEIPTLHEETNKSKFFENEEVPVIHEETKKKVFSENELHIPETHEVSEHVMIHSGFSENEEEIITTQESEIVSDESIYLQNEEEIPAVQDETEITIDNNPDEYITSSEVYQNEEVVTTPLNIQSSHENEREIVESTVENVPSESDLQIAEALINLPATALHSKTPTDTMENHIMTSSFEMDNVHEEIISASENIALEETVILEKPAKSTNKLEEQPFIPDDESVNLRFETEQEKSENLNAAQSLLRMSKSTISIPEPLETNEITKPVVQNVEHNNGIDKSLEKNMVQISTEIIKETQKIKKPFLTSSSKLLQMLEEPSRPKFAATRITPTKQIVMRGKEKILNFDVAKSSFKSKPHLPKQKIIIRRTTPSKTVLNNISEMASQDKIILSRSNLSQDGSSVQRFTIQTTPDAPSDANTIIIQQKIRKLSKPPTKLQKIKPHNSLVASVSETKPAAQTSVVDNAMFDINSMPIVLSEDLITAESIEKMPVVMSDANINPIITQPHHPPKVMKPKLNITENEKITVTSMPKKQEVKTTLLMNSVSEIQNKSTTPNILSKSAKLRAAKPMLVFDKTTGKQKIIMTKAESSIKEVKNIQKTPTLVHQTPTLVQKTPTLIQKAPALIQKAPTLIQKAPTMIQKAPTLLQKTPTLVQKTPTLLQKTPTMAQKTPTLIQTTPTLIQTTPTLIQNSPTWIQTAPALIQAAPQTIKKTSQAEKFLILPTQNTPRTGRTQKIVIDPQTGKAHMIMSKGNEASATATENKPVSAKLVPSKSETNAPGNTVMIITNAQGAQSRIVLTPEHEKILFPNKQQQKGSQLKTIAHRITTASALPQLKTVLNPPPMKQIVTSAKTPTRIVPKQKNAIITSKGQLIVGGQVATTSHNIAPMPEIRHVSKRLSQTEPRKLVQAIQKTNSEPIIFLQQKSGAVMQLTASQFDQLQRSGQIVQKTPAQPVQERVIIHKTRTIVEPGSSQKPRARKSAVHSPTPAKKSKHQHEIAIAPAPARHSPLLPALTPIITPSAPQPPPTPPTLSATPAPAITFAPAVNFSLTPAISTAVASSSTFSEFDNFEEMLPSTAIARQPMPEPAPPAPSAPPAPAPAEPAAAALADVQVMALPGEHFGGPAGSFYLCVEEHGTYTRIDNRPLVLEDNQLMPMSEVALQPQPERRDILSAALANSDVFHADADAPDFRDLNANVSVHCRVSETSSTLHQPIMTPQEMPSTAAAEQPPPATLEDGLAVIGVTPHTVPTSLELPITVTDPRIAPRTTDPLGSGGYSTTLMPSPGAELCYVSAEESVGPISMPLLTEEDDPGVGVGGKSMPILTDDIGERTASSVESALGSPASLGTEADDSSGVTWTRRLLTPGSDASDLSVEIPLQPSIQLSVGDLSDHT